jgi:hypothetical protein
MGAFLGLYICMVMNSFDLTDKNFMIYAMKAYDNPHCCSIEEFHEDLQKTKYIKRLFSRYKKTGELKEKLILNHIRVMYNVFDVSAATHILFFKIDEEFYPQLKTFLVFLSFMPDRLHLIRGQRINTVDIPLDNKLVEALRKI